MSTAINILLDKQVVNSDGSYIVYVHVNNPQVGANWGLTLNSPGRNLLLGYVASPFYPQSYQGIGLKFSSVTECIIYYQLNGSLVANATIDIPPPQLVNWTIQAIDNNSGNPIGQGFAINVSSANGFSGKTLTDSNGSTLWPNMMADTYTVTANIPGYQPYSNTFTISPPTASSTLLLMPNNPPPTVNWTLQAIDNNSGNPIGQGFTVGISGPSGSLTQVTDSTGSVLFQNLMPGYYTVSMSVPGYFPYSNSFTISPPTASNVIMLLVNNPPPNLQATIYLSENSGKPGDTVTATVSATGGVPPYSFADFVNSNPAGSGSSGFQHSFQQQLNNAGTYVFKDIVTDSNFSTVTVSATVTISGGGPPPPVGGFIGLALAMGAYSIFKHNGRMRKKVSALRLAIKRTFRKREKASKITLQRALQILRGRR